MIVVILIFSLLNISSPQIKIENAWLRPANKGMNTALYFDINNLTSKDYELTEVSSEIAKIVQIHETYKQGENMGMRKIESISIKGKSIFHLSPGSFHVMVIRLKEDLRAGDKKEFILSFKNHAKMKIIAIVKE